MISSEKAKKYLSIIETIRHIKAQISAFYCLSYEVCANIDIENKRQFTNTDIL